VRRLLWLLIVFSWTLHAFPSAAGLLEEAEALLPERLDVAVLQECIELYEQALAIEPDNTELMVMLAQLWHEHAILASTSLRQSSLQYAADYASWAMGLPSYIPLETMSLNELESFLEGVDDPGALLWAADSWGKLLQGQIRKAITIWAPSRFRSLYQRLIEVDETYFGAAGHRSMGALMAQTRVAGLAFPWASLENAREHLERALEIAPEYLPNYVVFAEEYAQRARDRALFVELLERALELPIDPYPVWNALAHDDARRLLED